jgi:DNA-binding MurR/RpiR family transcriptional regulator
MNGKTVADRIKADFEAMPLRMQAAARFVLAHPSEVALLSMRELARRAGVPASTMTRLAQRLGYPGFHDLKAVFADEMRGSLEWFSGRAVGMVTQREKLGEAGLVCDMAAALSDYVGALAAPRTISQFLAATDLLLAARRIYCIGARASFAVSFQFSHVQNYFWEKSVLLDAPGGVGIDLLGRAGPRDVMLAVSFNPHADSTLRAVEVAVAAACKVVAITDSELSLLGRRATVALIVPTRSSSFFDTITPAFAAGEILMALMASRIGAGVPEAVRRRERMLVASGVFRLEAGEEEVARRDRPVGNWPFPRDTDGGPPGRSGERCNFEPRERKGWRRDD